MKLEEQLRDAPVPDEAAAMERARRVVLAAHARRAPRRQRPAVRVGLAGAAAAAALALAFTPPGAAVAEWVGDVMRPGADDAQPVLDGLPAPGRLLVDAPSGPWIVQSDGSKRRLGAYDAAGWSPQGLFVAAARGRELLALEPDGDVRWSLAADRRVTGVRWAPNGLRIAYLAGPALRLVDGDGAPGKLLAARVSAVAPAWRPGSPQELAYADAAGRIRVIEPEAAGLRWRSRDRPAPVELSWSDDGDRLLARSPREVREYRADGRLLRRLPLRTSAAAWAPDGRIALARSLGRGRSEVLVLAGRGDKPRRVFAGAGRFSSLAWSPDGTWLGIAWREADQWLFIRTAETERIEAIGEVSRQFASGETGGFPELAEWCCARGP